MEKILSAYPIVATKYGLHARSDSVDIEFLPLLIEVTKVTQGSYVAFDLGGNPGPGLEVAAALTELISLRMAQVRSIGRIMPNESSVDPPDYAWLAWSGPVGAWETAGIRAVLSAYRYFLGASTLEVMSTGAEAQVTPLGCRGRLTSTVRTSLVNIAIWADIELGAIDASTLVMTIRPRSAE